MPKPDPATILTPDENTFDAGMGLHVATGGGERSEWTWDDGDPAGDRGTELSWLRRAESLGVPIAPMAVVAAQVEAAYYHLNQLGPRIETHFAHVDPADPDEDDLEELAPDALAWVLEHALLDEVVEAFYEALDGLPARLIVRRSGGPGLWALRGRPALLAVKRVWSRDWSLDTLTARLAAGAGLMPPPGPVLVHTADVHADPEAAHAAGSALGRPVGAWCDPRGRLVRLTLV